MKRTSENSVPSTRPGIDGRDADRPAEEILPQRVREAALGELRGDVRRAALVRGAPRDGADVDDVPPVGEVRQAEPRHPHQPGDVRAEDPRLVLVARLVERRAAERSAGVVDEDVEPAELLHRVGDEALRALGIGDVERQRDLGLEPLDAARAARDTHSGRGERARRRAPDSRRRPRDDRAFPGQIHRS